MPSILDLWQSNPDLISGKGVQQILVFCGDGSLREGNETSSEFRAFLAVLPSEKLAAYAHECLESSFTQSGFALQDVVNQIGTRLGFRVSAGRYRGTRNEVGFDGIWATADGYQFIVEIKTTDAYRINLDTVASYRSNLIASGAVKKDQSSILIVVGRQDTGDLEAQIRGSRHAWDVRLISTDAALRLMALKENLSDWATSTRINEILKPMEYTRVDPIIDLIFTTSGEMTEESEHPVEETDGQPHQPPSPLRFDAAALRTQAVQRVGTCLHLQFVKKGKVFYASADGKLDLICLASQPYSRGGSSSYWYGFKPGQKRFLTETENGAVALACGTPDKLLLIPAPDFLPLLDGMNETAGQHWHVKLLWKGGKILLDQPRAGERADLARYLLRPKD